MDLSSAIPRRHVERTRLQSIPSEWEVVRLGAIAETQYGLSVAANDSGGTPIVGMSNLNDGQVRFEKLSYVSLAENEVDRFALKSDDILFNRTNSLDLVGKTAVVTVTPITSTVFASYLIRLKLDTRKVDPAYFSFFMNSYSAVCWLKALATPGISQYNISASCLCAQLLVPLPPLEEQQKIAAILNCWEVGRQQVRDDITSKLSLVRGLGQQLLTGKLRFREFTDPWETEKLGDLFRERKETGRGDLPLLSITNGRGVIPREEVDRKDSSNPDKKNYKRITCEDIGYNTMRMWQGVSALSKLEGIVSPAYTICTPRSGVDGGFAAHLFKLPKVVNMFYRFSQGLVNDTLQLRYSNFAKIKVTIPGLEEQRRIAAVLDKAHHEIDLLKIELDLLRKQERGLMQKLLTGKKRVKA